MLGYYYSIAYRISVHYYKNYLMNLRYANCNGRVVPSVDRLLPQIFPFPTRQPAPVPISRVLYARVRVRTYVYM